MSIPLFHMNPWVGQLYKPMVGDTCTRSVKLMVGDQDATQYIMRLRACSIPMQNALGLLGSNLYVNTSAVLAEIPASNSASTTQGALLARVSMS